MIKIEFVIAYPGLNTNEELRIVEALRKTLQPFIATVCCAQVKDWVPPADEGEFIKSQHLDIYPSYNIF